MDFVQWLRDQLDLDAVRAMAAAEEDGPDWHYDGHAVITRREGDLVAVGSQDFMESERGVHIAEHDPARVLREIDAKRKLLDDLFPALEQTDGLVESEWNSHDDLAGKLLSLLALPYADRPGFKEEWRP